MITLEQILNPMTTQEFFENYLCRKPLAQPGSAIAARRLLSWDLLESIIKTPHRDCWLVKTGKLSLKHQDENFRLTFLEAIRGFNQGYSILIRHSEMAHPKLNEIAKAFFEKFWNPVDIQLYATPAGMEGFDWHYDCEDVFVVQSQGQKEFYLRKSTDIILSPQNAVPQSYADFLNRTTDAEIRCLLNAGDFLYIPRGYWHKARAITDSFHLSIGVNFGNARHILI